MSKRNKIIAAIVFLGVIVVAAFLVYNYSMKDDRDTLLDMVIVDATWDEDIARVAPVMTDEERRVFQTTMVKMVLAGEKVEGLTFRQLLEKGQKQADDFMSQVEKDMEEFFVRDSLVRDSLRQDSISKGLK